MFFDKIHSRIRFFLCQKSQALKEPILREDNYLMKQLPKLKNFILKGVYLVKENPYGTVLFHLD